MFKMFLVLFMWSVLGFAGLVFWFGQQGRMARVDAQCFYYRQHGVPTAITVEGATYKLTADGRIDPLERPFVNPWHEEILRGLSDGDCVLIDTGGVR